jgi:RNA polymerase sigma-70 factor (ECF subfamily)
MVAVSRRGSAPFADSSDDDLVAAIASERHDALEEASRRHGARVHRLALRFCGRAADDVVQEVFLRLWHRPDRYDPARGSLQTYVVMQARGEALDTLRRDRARR